MDWSFKVYNILIFDNPFKLLFSHWIPIIWVFSKLVWYVGFDRIHKQSKTSKYRRSKRPDRIFEKKMMQTLPVDWPSSVYYSCSKKDCTYNYTLNYNEMTIVDIGFMDGFWRQKWTTNYCITHMRGSDRQALQPEVVEEAPAQSAVRRVLICGCRKIQIDLPPKRFRSQTKIRQVRGFQLTRLLAQIKIKRIKHSKSWNTQKNTQGERYPNKFAGLYLKDHCVGRGGCIIVKAFFFRAKNLFSLYFQWKWGLHNWRSFAGRGCNIY